MFDKEDLNINVNNMKFTDQRDFFTALSETMFNEDELLIDATFERIDITKENIKKAILKSLNMAHQKDRACMYLTIDNLLSVSKDHISSIKELIRTGKMASNIQTVDNRRSDLEYKSFALSHLENELLNRINGLSESVKNEILNINITDKEIMNNFIDPYTTQGIVSHFSFLANTLFTYNHMSPEKHEYDINENNKKNNLDSISTENKKEDLIRYACEIKSFNDMMKKKPWYVRWFSSDYRKKMNEINNVKVILYNRGISKASLNKFLSSNGDLTAQDKLYNVNKVEIDKINKANKDKVSQYESVQDELNLKNFFKEQMYSDKAKETLDKLSEPIEDKDAYTQLEEARKSVNEDKQTCEGYLKDNKYSMSSREFFKHVIKESDNHIDLINKLEEGLNNNINNEKENDIDLSFDPSKEIIETSDELQNKLGLDLEDDFVEETLNAFKDEAKEVVEERKI